MKTIQDVLSRMEIIKQYDILDDNSFIAIEKTGRKYIFYRFIYTTDIADWILENMKKRGDKIPEKHWSWRHVEDFKTLRDARVEYNKYLNLINI